MIGAFRWDVQATERFGAASVYFVLLGSGEAGKLGISCAMFACGVSAFAMLRVI